MRVPEHLKNFFDILQDRMWKIRDGRFVVRYGGEEVRQTFASHMEEHMDMLNG